MATFLYLCAKNNESSMEQKLVGREVELEDLNKYLNSEKSELFHILLINLLLRILHVAHYFIFCKI